MYYKPYYYLNGSTELSTFTLSTLNENPTFSIKGPAMYIVACSELNGIENCTITSANRSFVYPEINADKIYFSWLEERYDGAYMVYMDTDSTFIYEGNKNTNITRLTCFHLEHI